MRRFKKIEREKVERRERENKSALKSGRVNGTSG